MSRIRLRGLSTALGVLAGIVLLAGSTAPVAHASSSHQALVLQSRVHAGRIVSEDPPPPPPPHPHPAVSSGAIGRLC